MYFNVKLLILNDYKEAVMKETVIVLYSLSNLSNLKYILFNLKYTVCAHSVQFTLNTSSQR